MSFLVDPPMLVAAGAASNLLPDERSRKVAERAVVATFIVTSASLYVNAGWTRWLWELCRADSGRDWMINSGVTTFEHERPKPAVHVLGLALFAAYPLWFRLGARVATARTGAGRSPASGGRARPAARS